MSFPLLPTVKAAYRDVYGDMKSFFRATWLIWVLLIVFVQVPTEFLNMQVQDELKNNISDNVAFSEIAPAVEADKPADAPVASPADPEAPKGHVSSKTALMFLGVNIIQALIIFCFTLAWFRALLLHERRGQLILPRLGRREFLYIWANMKVSLIISPIFLLLAGYLMGDGTTVMMTPVKTFVLLGGIYLVLYLQARVLLAYPLSATDQNEATIVSSWKLTRGNGARIVLGNIMVFMPQMIGLMAIISGLAYLLSLVTGKPPEGQPVTQPFIVEFLLKSLGSYFLIALLAVTSAFHARVYATLIKK